MDDTLWLLHATVLAAALLQAATGIGFGVIAGPIILLAMNSGAAIQVSILLSLLIAVVLAPSLYRKADRTILRRLLIGTMVGLPIGIAVFLVVTVDVLKLLAGLAVLFMALSVAGLWRSATSSQSVASAIRRDYGTGVLSGAMSAGLAMPGPVAAARLTTLAHGKETIRATILVMFVVSYTAAFAFQAVFVGVSSEALGLSAQLVPATVIGVVIGRLAVSLISERAFRWLIVAILLATAVSLLASSLGPVVGGLWNGDVT